MTYPSKVCFSSLDVETTLNGDEKVGLAHPMHPDNRIVAMGVCKRDSDSFSKFLEKGKEEDDVLNLLITADISYEQRDTVIVCGQNIGFDLLYIYKTSPVAKTLIQNFKLWDIQLAEYILTAQRSKYASLDEMSKKYGFPVKDDTITKYFEAGIGADKIPEDELRPYLSRDVINTRGIAIKQFLLAKEAGQLPLIESQMEALHATIEMMFNGLTVDYPALEKYAVQVANDYVDCKTSLQALAGEDVEDVDSPKQWSQFFFGGTKKVKTKDHVGFYKNGKPKFKLVEREVTVPAFVSWKPDADKISKTGQVSVDDSVLKELLLHLYPGSATELVTKLMNYRELSKQLSTYVQGLGNHVIGNKIHGNLNHTSTVTGRLSSTRPNLQNISNNPIKKIFVSSYTGGYLVEVDFNQLEVVALAHITRDKQLIKDITDGVDIHSALYEGLFGRKPTKEERKPFKSRTFQLIYGAGARAIAKQAGCSLEEAQRFIKVFYTRYPCVAIWHESVRLNVESLARHERDSEELLEKFSSTTIQSETGRKYYYKEYWNDKAYGASDWSFSPTELKNYPVQGLATADIVPMMLGVLFKKFVSVNGVKLINTIHDSVLFDVDPTKIGWFLVEVMEVMRNTHKYFERQFGTPLALKLNASVSVGDNWFDMKEISV